MKKLNHAGIRIDLDEEKGQAVLTLPDSTQIRTGTKQFNTPTEFQVYLENKAMELKRIIEQVSRHESEALALDRLHAEAVTAVDNLKSEDYEGDMTAFAFAAQQKAQAVRFQLESLTRAQEEVEAARNTLKSLTEDLVSNDAS